MKKFLAIVSATATILSALGASCNASAADNRTDCVLQVIEDQLDSIRYADYATTAQNAALANNDGQWFNDAIAGITANDYSCGPVTYDTETHTFWYENGDSVATFVPAMLYEANPDEGAWATATYFGIDLVDSKGLMVNIWRNGTTACVNLEWVDGKCSNGQRIDLNSRDNANQKLLFETGGTYYEGKLRLECKTFDMALAGQLGNIADAIKASLEGTCISEPLPPKEMIVAECETETTAPAIAEPDIIIEDRFAKLEIHSVADVYYDVIANEFLIVYDNTATSAGCVADCIRALRAYEV